MSQQTHLPLPMPAADAAQRRLVQVLFIGVFMAALDSAIVGPVLPALREAFGVDNRTAGLLTTVFSLSSLCSTALMAYFSDRHGRRPVYLASVAIFAIGSLCIAAAPDFDMLLVGRAIQGIGAGFIPKNLDTDLLDGVIQVDAEAAREFARRSAREEGMLVGLSSGATLAAIAHKLPDLPAGATVLGFNYDTGERYLSVEGFLPQG